MKSPLTINRSYVIIVCKRDKKMKTDKRNFSVYLDIDIAESAKEVAEEEWLSLSRLINKLLEEHVDEFYQEQRRNIQDSRQPTDKADSD